MNKEEIPSIIFYDQDFVDLYDRSWVWIDELWKQGSVSDGKAASPTFISHEGQTSVNLFDTCLSSLFLGYSNQVYSPFEAIDYFYSRQEEDGAIRSDYSLEDGRPVFSAENPQGVCLPLLPYVEYFFFHKIGNKKRLKEVVPVLEKYFNWLKANFQKENGLFSVPVSACGTGGVPREEAVYQLDFNTVVAINALFFSMIGDILNDKELSFRYKKLYFILKTRINSLMWDPETSFYYDLDAEEKRLPLKMISAYWTLLAEIPNDEKATLMVEKLKDPSYFGTENPFPNVSADSPCFREDAYNLCGAVVPFNTYFVVKGLEKYGERVFARECAIRNIYFILDTLNPDEDRQGDTWEAYLPSREGFPSGADNMPFFPRRRFLPQLCLMTITLMIEDVVGLDISLPRKTVNWTVPSLEVMGIDKLSLKRNFISIMSSKNTRGWEIRLESEKLYYFTIEIIDEDKRKTLPIPSGKCSMLIDKL